MLLGSRSDEALVRMARRGSRRALDELMRRHRDRTFRVCRAILHSPEDAADATQEALVAAVRHLDRFQGRSSFTTWLHSIATRKAYDLLRQRRPEPLDPDMIAETAPDTDDGFASAGEQQRLLAAIATLDAGFREAFLLVDVQGASIAEAARAMGIKPGTAKSRLFRARALLASELADTPPPGTFAMPGASDPQEDAP